MAEHLDYSRASANWSELNGAALVLAEGALVKPQEGSFHLTLKLQVPGRRLGLTISLGGPIVGSLLTVPHLKIANGQLLRDGMRTVSRALTCRFIQRCFR